jgi:sugar phosphate permease
MSVLFTLTTLFLVMSGLQYWITDYVVSVLGHNKETAFIVFILVGALGPILGVAFSGCIFDRIGGYHGRNTPVVFTIFLIIAGCMAVLSFLTTNLYIMSVAILL